MSNQNVGAVYSQIIDEVIESSRVDFEESGVEEAVLAELQRVSPSFSLAIRPFLRLLPNLIIKPPSSFPLIVVFGFLSSWRMLANSIFFFFPFFSILRRLLAWSTCPFETMIFGGKPARTYQVVFVSRGVGRRRLSGGGDPALFGSF